jgi:CBS domain-containing protein
MEDLTVGAAMSTELIALAPDTSLTSAARLLVTSRISGAPVIDAGGRPMGVVSLTDLADPDRPRSDDEGVCAYYRYDHGVMHLEGDGTVTRDGVVADVMTRHVLAVAPTTQLIEAIRYMSQLAVHRLLVADGDKLVGIITSMDVLRAIAQSAPKVDQPAKVG